MFLSVGETYNRYAPVANWATTLDFGTKLGGTNFYSISTLVMQSQTSTMRTGVGYLIKKSGPVSVYGLMDGGVTSTTGANTSVNLGNVGGGVVVRYDLGSITPKLSGFGAAVQFRETAVAGNSVAPELSAKLTYYLK